MVTTVITKQMGLEILSFALEKLVVGAALAMSVIFQSELRRFLEDLGRGNLFQLFSSNRRISYGSDTAIDRLVETVKELSQNRVGALIMIETTNPVDERDFAVAGVRLNADLSKELLQSIFQTTTPLHDGAVLIRGDRILSAGIILPLSERSASRQLGTRHRAAMGITERISYCLCIVVSEETGSISLAEQGNLNRPLTASKLKEILTSRFAKENERESTNPSLKLLLKGITKKLSTRKKRDLN
jgi:uncharacterized protein (TIGR00159 family)